MKRLISLLLAMLLLFAAFSFAETAEERAARVARGRERAARFSWPDHAAGLVRLLTECGGKP